MDNQDTLKSKVDQSLQKRMREFDIALQKQKEDPKYLYEEVKSVDIVIRFEIILTPPHDNIGLADGLYIYMNENGIIVDAEYYIKENDSDNLHCLWLGEVI